MMRRQTGAQLNQNLTLSPENSSSICFLLLPSVEVLGAAGPDVLLFIRVLQLLQGSRVVPGPDWIYKHQCVLGRIPGGRARKSLHRGEPGRVQEASWSVQVELQSAPSLWTATWSGSVCDLTVWSPTNARDRRPRARLPLLTAQYDDRLNFTVSMKSFTHITVLLTCRDNNRKYLIILFINTL